MTAEQPGPTPMRPRRPRRADDPRAHYPIDVRDTSLPKMTATAWSAIQALNDPPELFVAGTTPVRVIGGENDVAVKAEEVTPDILSRWSARSAFWFKPTESRGDVEQFPIERVMRDMLSDPRPPLPPLDRVVTAPVYGRDGSLADQAGYNAGSRIYFAPGRLDVGPVQEVPNDAETAEALDFIRSDVFGDFPFTGDAEFAHAVSLLLNPFVRDLIDGPTPLYMVEAPNAGEGKTLLAKVGLLPALGRDPLVLPPAAQDEEMRKRITATLQDLPEAVLMDNVSKALDSPSLAAALTTDSWTDRVLGRSETRTFKIRATWVATANNPALTREVSRRTIRIRIDSKRERPETRTGFRHPRLEHWVKLNRGVAIAAALTLVNRWLSTGGIPGDYTLGSYDSWAGVHGGILDACGIPGFLTNRVDQEVALTSDEAGWDTLVALWWEQHKDNPVPVGTLYELARDKVEGIPLRGANDRAQKTSFGMQLTKQRDRVFNNRRIKYLGTRVTADNVSHYSLEWDAEAPF